MTQLDTVRQESIKGQNIALKYKHGLTVFIIFDMLQEVWDASWCVWFYSVYTSLLAGEEVFSPSNTEIQNYSIYTGLGKKTQILVIL